MMQKIIISTLLSSLLLTGSLMAKSDTELSSKEVNKNATEMATKKVNDTKVVLIKEALSSLEISAKALKNLEENKKDEAKKNIELALGKLEVILASKKVPKLLPIENRLVVKNFVGGAKEVDIALKEVKKLIESGKVQEAGELLISLQSELDISTISLPLATYPDALKLASKYLVESKIEEAKDTLKLALSTFANVETIIPIPLINTIELVAIASSKAKENKELALKYLNSAHDELDKAEKLGYLSKSTTTYKELHLLIKNVEKEVNGPNKAEKLFNELGEKLKEFKSKIFSSDKSNNKG
jgi:ribosomal protein S20